MGWTVRKTIKLGPVNLNLSKRGVGASVGAGGFRIGVDSMGRPFLTFSKGPFRGRWGREDLQELVEEKPADDDLDGTKR